MPALAAIMAYKHAPPLAIVDHTNHERIGVVLVRQNRAYVAMRVSMVRSRERLGSVVARQHAAAVGGEQNSIRIARVHQNIVYNHLGTAHVFPRLTAIYG